MSGKTKRSSYKGVKLLLASAVLVGGVLTLDIKGASASIDVPIDLGADVNTTVIGDTSVSSPTEVENAVLVNNGNLVFVLESTALTTKQNKTLPISMRVIANKKFKDVSFQVKTATGKDVSKSTGVTVLSKKLGSVSVGEVGLEDSLTFSKRGVTHIKGVIIADGVKLETEWLPIDVTTGDAVVPNTKLPSVHGLSVATLVPSVNVATYKKSNGKFVNSGVAKKGIELSVVGVDSNYYKLSNGLFIDADGSSKLSIAKVDVRKANNKIYDINGAVTGVLKKGQRYDVLDYTDTHYRISDDRYIKKETGNVLLQGIVSLNSKTPLLDAKGKTVRQLKKGEAYMVYSMDKKYIYVGGGQKVVNNTKVSKFTK